MTQSLTIRATQVEQVGVVLQMGETYTTLQTEPRRRWAVSVDHGSENLEIVGLFDSEARAVEAAEALERQIKAELGTDGAGPRLATRDGQVLQ